VVPRGDAGHLDQPSLRAGHRPTPSLSEVGEHLRADQAPDGVDHRLDHITAEDQGQTGCGKAPAVNKVITTQAFGDSMDGAPATTDMHFRLGAVAFEYVSTLLMEYVDEHKIALNETSGYPDFETDPGWTAAFNTNPFQIFTYQQRIAYAFDRPCSSHPGPTGATPISIS
jgi:hypothetical protein